MIQQLQQWSESLMQQQELLIIIAVISALTFIGTLVLVPWLLLRVPADYFINRELYIERRTQQHPLIRAVVLILKNLLGLILLIAGLLMLVLPGQGLLTVLMGILLLNFPGKYRLERALVSRPAVLKSINWLRRKYSREEIRVQSQAERSES